MSEPLDPDTAARIARTRAMAARVRKVDLPAVAADVRIGTLVHRARPAQRPPVRAVCPHCEASFEPGRRHQVYCSHVCQMARRSKPGAQRPEVPIGDMRRIQGIVAEAFGVPVNALIAPGRTFNIAWPRQAAMMLCRVLTGASYPQIGRAFGNRDHTTVIAAMRNGEARLSGERFKDVEWATLYRRAEAACRAAFDNRPYAESAPFGTIQSAEAGDA